MAVEDILPSVVVIGLIYLLVKWLTGSKNPPGPDTPIRGVTAPMVETVHSAFPHVPIPNIVYHLSKTRSAQATSEEIIERGTLPTPPTTFQVPPSLLPASQNPPSLPSSPTSSTGKLNIPSNPPQKSLIERFDLSSRLSAVSGEEVVEVVGSVGSSGKWEDTKERRERELRERKERMVLAARRRLMEKEAKEQSSTLLG